MYNTAVLIVVRGVYAPTTRTLQLLAAVDLQQFNSGSLCVTYISKLKAEHLSRLFTEKVCTFFACEYLYLDPITDSHSYTACCVRCTYEGRSSPSVSRRRLWGFCVPIYSRFDIGNSITTQEKRTKEDDSYTRTSTGINLCYKQQEQQQFVMIVFILIVVLG